MVISRTHYTNDQHQENWRPTPALSGNVVSVWRSRAAHQYQWTGLREMNTSEALAQP